MQTALSAPLRPILARRTKIGIGATVATLVLLVYPGQMALPMSALSPLMPRMSGCANFAMGFIGLAFFGLAFVISGVLIGLGIVAVAAAARGNRKGVIGSVLINAVVISLLLMTPLEFSPNVDAGVFGLYAVLTVCAVIPATALVLLLSPTTFRSSWHSRRPFLATAIAAGLLLLPGAAATVALGFQVASYASSQPAASPVASTTARC